jgi:hypothetical protein
VSSRRAGAIAAIATVARALGLERQRVVFVGGTVTALYPLDGGSDVRPTKDVDFVIDVSTTHEYYDFVAPLQERGFRPCADENAPVCRLVYAGIRVDVSATVDTSISPTNRWYRDAVANAATYAVAADVEARGITPIYFVATKLDALRGPGGGDFQASHDLEDALAVLAGLGALRAEVATSNDDVAVAIRRELAHLSESEAFIDAVRGHFEGDSAGQALADSVVTWLATLVR